MNIDMLSGGNKAYIQNALFDVHGRHAAVVAHDLHL